MSTYSLPWKIRVRADIAVAIEERLLDDATGRPRYGSRTALINDLLEKWLRDEEELDRLELSNPAPPPALADGLFPDTSED